MAIYILFAMKVKLICPDCGSFEVKKIAMAFLILITLILIA